MKQSGRLSYDKCLGMLGTTAMWIVRIVGSLIFVVLTRYALQYTQYSNPYGEERSISVYDSIAKNILFFILTVAVLVGLFVLEKHMSAQIQKWVMRIALVLVTVWTGGFGYWWITAIDRLPVGDQAFIYGGASYFLEGQYVFLSEGQYCEMFPYQLGLVFLIEILFRLVGPYNYFAFQFICVMLSVGIVLLGYALIREFTEHVAVAVAYCLLMFTCLPMIFYTGWVYGEIPSIFFYVLTAVCVMRYHKTAHARWLAGMVGSVFMAILVRNNSMIMLVALCLVAGIYMLQRKDKRLLVALLAAVILPTLAYQGIYKMYEVRSGYPHKEGVPMVSYVAMGLQETDGKCGWYNNYVKEVYYGQEFNSDMAALESQLYIRSRLEEFKANPSAARTFFKNKILSQWNAPLYQSVFFSSQYGNGIAPVPGSFLDKLSGEKFTSVLGICDRVQFILYVGMLCYFLFAVKKGGNMLEYLLAVTMIGGFFFSIIWEAKARYIFPYYVTMFPLAVVGYWQAIVRIKALFARKPKAKSEDNIIPFERVA